MFGVGFKHRFLYFKISLNNYKNFLLFPCDFQTLLLQIIDLKKMLALPN